MAADPHEPVALVEFEMDRLEALVDLWRACFEFGVGITDPNPIELQRRAFVEKVLPNNTVRMALRGGQLLGFVAASRTSVEQLHVGLGHHRLGIGTQLLDWAKAQSGGSLWLYTFACNTGAQAFYERNGFVVAERGFEATWQLDDIKYTWASGRPGKARAAFV